jgi:hypothetical protein
MRSRPVFHIPVGHTRDTNGEVMTFEGGPSDWDPVMEEWMDKVLSHPATLASGGCVIIGPTQVQHCDVRTRTMSISKPKDTGWQPATVSDGPVRCAR